MGNLKGVGPATRVDLDKARCVGGCGHAECDGSIVLVCKSHRGSPVYLSYSPDTGQLSATCATCMQRFVSVLVAGSVPS